MLIRTLSICVLTAGLLAGCDPGSPRGTPSAPAGQTPPVTPSSAAADPGPVTAKRLRAALVTAFRGATLEKDPSIQIGKGPIASGPYGRLDHATTSAGLLQIKPERCQAALQLVPPGKAPKAPAAAITLRKSDEESADELLVARPPAEIEAVLRQRIPAGCGTVTVMGGQPASVSDFQPPPFGPPARGIRTTVTSKTGSFPASHSCSISFRTGGGRVLAEVGYGGPNADEACGQALDLAREAHSKIERTLR